MLVRAILIILRLQDLQLYSVISNNCHRFLPQNGHGVSVRGGKTGVREQNSRRHGRRRFFAKKVRLLRSKLPRILALRAKKFSGTLLQEASKPEPPLFPATITSYGIHPLLSRRLHRLEKPHAWKSEIGRLLVFPVLWEPYVSTTDA